MAKITTIPVVVNGDKRGAIIATNVVSAGIRLLRLDGYRFVRRLPQTLAVAADLTARIRIVKFGIELLEDLGCSFKRTGAAGQPANTVDLFL